MHLLNSQMGLNEAWPAPVVCVLKYPPKSLMLIVLVMQPFGSIAFSVLAPAFASGVNWPEVAASQAAQSANGTDPLGHALALRSPSTYVTPVERGSSVGRKSGAGSAEFAYAG